MVKGQIKRRATERKNFYKKERTQRGEIEKIWKRWKKKKNL